jgi:toxin ParE1/3/4
MNRLVWLESAKLDLIDIQAYYAENASPEIANKLLKRIYESASTLVDQPLVGVTTMDDDILEWHLPGLNYTLPYMIHGNDIEILRVFHQAQNKPSKWERKG